MIAWSSTADDDKGKRLINYYPLLLHHSRSLVSLFPIVKVPTCRGILILWYRSSILFKLADFNYVKVPITINIPLARLHLAILYNSPSYRNNLLYIGENKIL